MEIKKEKYINMIENVNIKKICLKNIFLEDVEFPNDNEEKLEVNLEYGCNEFELAQNNDDLIIFYPEFMLKIISKKKETVNLKFKMSVIYNIKNIKNYEQEYIIKFMENNLPINVWPYARELISSLTTRIGYPALMIEPYRRF